MAESDSKALEFDVVRRLLERLASTPYGADAARALEPAPGVAEAQRMQDAIGAARRLLEAGEHLHFPGTPDVRAALRQAAPTGSSLSGMALYHLALVIALGARLHPVVTRAPALYPEPRDLEAAAPVGEVLRGAVGPNGQVLPEASPRLTELHAQWRELQAQVAKDLAAHAVRLLGISPADAASRVVWPGGRGALTLPPAVAEGVKGVRRGMSSTGRDLIVEPVEIVALNNRLETVRGQQEAEQAAVRRALTSSVRAHLPVLDRLVGALTWIDLAAAGARLAVQMNAIPPRLVDVPAIRLEGAFHPGLLLQRADVAAGPTPVPLSLELNAEQPIVIITGPNTGGKTVVLKTVGLLTLMAQCGLHLPSQGQCTIGGFRNVIVGIGDSQSLYHHLSTFAGHVQTLKRAVDEAAPDTLVLLDELGTGTDPEEGAALAMAVLDELVARNVFALITTHLPPLKGYAAREPRAVSAAMEFDQERLAPTYRLTIGSVGVSHGLTIAGRNGLPEALIARARAYLSQMGAPTATAGRGGEAGTEDGAESR
ncbi:MAG: endonuclease MutS2 [Acidiferrobacteraceae bacterium]